MPEHTRMVDGNALSGPLAEVLRTDASIVRIRCAHCGSAGMLAEAIVELDDSAAIVRCRSCTHTLFTAAWTMDAVTLTIGGLDLAFPRSA